LPQCQLAGEVGAEGLIEAEAAGDIRRRPRRRDGSAFLQFLRRRASEGAEIALVLEGEFDGGDLAGSQWVRVGDVRVFLTLPSLAEGFAEVDGLVGFAVGKEGQRARATCMSTL